MRRGLGSLGAVGFFASFLYLVYGNASRLPFLVAIGVSLALMVVGQTGPKREPQLEDKISGVAGSLLGCGLVIFLGASFLAFVFGSGVNPMAPTHGPSAPPPLISMAQLAGGVLCGLGVLTALGAMGVAIARRVRS